MLPEKCINDVLFDSIPSPKKPQKELHMVPSLPLIKAFIEVSVLNSVNI